MENIWEAQSYFISWVSSLTQRHRTIGLSLSNPEGDSPSKKTFTQISFNHGNAGLGFGKRSQMIWLDGNCFLFAWERSDGSKGMLCDLNQWLHPKSCPSWKWAVNNRTHHPLTLWRTGWEEKWRHSVRILVPSLYLSSLRYLQDFFSLSNSTADHGSKDTYFYTFCLLVPLGPSFDFTIFSNKEKI